MPTPTSANSGFTRMDLLAVAAITALLLALGAPAWGTARTKSLRLTCQDQLRELGAGFRLYARDNHDRYPMGVSTNEGGSADYLGPSARAGAESCWRHLWVLSNYVRSPALFVCPTDTGRYVATDFTDLTRSNAAWNAAISYGVGAEADFSRPAMLLLADRSIEGGSLKFTFDGSALRGNIGTNVASLSTIQWSTNGLHHGAGNVALADGSVRSWSTPGLRTGLANSGDALNNYCQPGHGPGL